MNLMEQQEVFRIMNENPSFHLATCVDGEPYCRGMLLYKADEKEIIFHTGKFKNLFSQINKNNKAELCFVDFKNFIQVRVRGELQMDESIDLKNEIVNHPTRDFLKSYVQIDPELEGFAVFKVKNPRYYLWTMEKNLNPTEYAEL